ncbi:MAG: 1-acyl-sn-glycerol-3-phosphate acyltransferase [Treponema sp.]|nr:1-acyl-sn-glycerol-3-phosphate acyltransferase [Treponema sp.]
MFPPDLPPVSNWALYAYRVLIKWFSFFIFGLGSVLLTVVCFPILNIIFHPRERFQKYGRRFVSFMLRFFVFVMHVLGIVNLEPDDREKYRHLTSKIIVANHPSLLDVVMLFSLIPNADCIVNSYLNRHLLAGLVRQLYILTSRELDDILQACTKSLEHGNCLLIFPEGTRTRRFGKPILKKGAARVALASGCNIVPVHIGGTDKFGLGKKDPWLGFNPRERYVYRIDMGPEINPEKYRNLPPPAAAKLITDEISAFLFPAKAAAGTGHDDTPCVNERI